MSDVGDVGDFGGWGLGTEVGPMAGSQWSKSDLEALRALGILPDGIGGFKYGQQGGFPSEYGGSGLEKLQGKTSGGGPGTTSGLGAQSPDYSSLGGSSSRSSSGGFSSDAQKPHDIGKKDKDPFGFGSLSQANSTPNLIAGVAPGLFWDARDRMLGQRRNMLNEPMKDVEYVKPSYTSQPNPYTMSPETISNAMAGRNFLEQLLRSRGGR